MVHPMKSPMYPPKILNQICIGNYFEFGVSDNHKIYNRCSKDLPAFPTRF